MKNIKDSIFTNSPAMEPDIAALRVDTVKSLRASLTSLSEAKGSRRILAMDSDIRMMASSCLLWRFWN